MSITLKRLQEIVGEQLGIEPDRISPNAHFIQEFGADSLDIIELVLTIEYEFDINIEDNYASQIHTVQDVLNYIDQKFENQ